MQPRELRFGPREWLGAIGDAGTLIPILLALSVLNGIDLNRALLLSGMSYVVSALWFRLPVPVQPLKAMAAVALMRGLDTSVIAAAAALMGVTFLAFGLTGLIPRLERLFPRPVIKGVQAGVGVMLAVAALRLLLPATAPAGGPAVSAGSTIEAWDFVTAFVLLVVPQLPLTLGNAVFASSDALRSYFREDAAKAHPAALATSIGLTNLAAFALGAYPLCHGSGGVTAHYRFGARTGGATLLFGLALLAVALLLPFTSFELLSSIPPPLLGAMLLYVAARHLQLAAQWQTRGEAAVTVAMAAIAFFTANLAWSLAGGWLMIAALRWKLAPAAGSRAPTT